MIFPIFYEGKDGDISGSLVESNYPVSVVSGCQSANVPMDNKWNNYLAEMEVPVKFWKNTFHIAKIKGRRTNPIIRIFTTNTTDTDTTTVIAYGKNTTDTIIIEKNSAMYNSNFYEYRPKEGYITLKSDKQIKIITISFLPLIMRIINF